MEKSYFDIRRRQKVFSLSKNIHTGSEAHPAYHSVVTKSHFPGVSYLGLKLTTDLRLKSRLRMSAVASLVL